MPFLPDLSVLTSVYQGEKYLPSFLEGLRAQTIFPRCELVLVLNEPSATEKRVAKKFSSKYRRQVLVHHVEKVETLGASWNRAWQLARAPNLALWNVDDRRLPDSLDRQLSGLEEKPDWALCYGDYIKVPKYGQVLGKRRRTPPYRAGHFRRAFAQGGAFWVFRRQISEEVGYFDEQFTVAADMDFSFRIAARGLQMGRCDGLLGYFTDDQGGLSTRDGAQRAFIERTAVQVRYGVFDKVQPQWLKAANHYRFNEVKNFEEWRALSQYLPAQADYLRSRRHLWIVGAFRNFLREFLERLGLLKLAYRSQESIFKREI